MILADWIAIGALALFCLIGFIVGFGRGLRFFASGFFGVIIAIIVCYCLGGVVYKFGFIQELLGKLNTVLKEKGGFCNFLLTIHIDLITFYVALFIIVMIIRLIIVKIVSSIVEVDNIFLKFINKTLGMVLFAVILLVLLLISFQIIALIGGSTESATLSFISGSKLQLEWLYNNNPISTIINIFVLKKTVVT